MFGKTNKCLRKDQLCVAEGGPCKAEQVRESLCLKTRDIQVVFLNQTDKDSRNADSKCDQ